MKAVYIHYESAMNVVNDLPEHVFRKPTDGWKAPNHKELESYIRSLGCYVSPSNGHLMLNLLCEDIGLGKRAYRDFQLYLSSGSAKDIPYERWFVLVEHHHQGAMDRLVQ